MISRRLAALGVVVALAGCSEPAPPVEAPPTEVGTIEARSRPVALALEYPAWMRGALEVEVRARVSGILLERLYEEGAPVGKGALLFRIDPAPFRAEVARMRAELGVRQADLRVAARERDRIAALVEQKLVSRREYDAAIADFEMAQAAVAAAEAALRTAELDLSYTEVRAPIAGLTGAEMRSVGSLVTAGTDSSLLTHIVETRRLHAEFSVPEADAALLRAALARGAGNGAACSSDPGRDRGDCAATSAASQGVRVELLDGGRVAGVARIDFVAPRVDTGTGTVSVRAVLDDGDGTLLPGQVVRARVEGVELPPAVVIPRRAVMHGPEGAYVWVVNAEERIEARPVQLAVAIGNEIPVSGGLREGERVVVDGIVKVQPGSPVRALTVAPRAPPGGGGSAAGSPPAGPAS